MIRLSQICILSSMSFSNGFLLSALIVFLLFFGLLRFGLSSIWCSDSSLFDLRSWDSFMHSIVLSIIIIINFVSLVYIHSIV
jgi:hypothetical protein